MPQIAPELADRPDDQSDGYDCLRPASSDVLDKLPCDLPPAEDMINWAHVRPTSPGWEQEESEDS